MSHLRWSRVRRPEPLKPCHGHPLVTRAALHSSFLAAGDPTKKAIKSGTFLDPDVLQTLHKTSRDARLQDLETVTFSENEECDEMWRRSFNRPQDGV